MTILLTGGTGKTGIRLAHLLHDYGKAPFLLASRSGEAPAPFEGVQFDWLDESTYDLPFQKAQDIVRIYLVAPTNVPDPVPPMKAFIDFAIKNHSVQRFVLLSASISNQADLSWEVYTSTFLIWVVTIVCFARAFSCNFSEMKHRQTIKTEDTIYTAAGDGRIAFVDIADIAEVALGALVDEKSHNTDHIIVGPELLNHNELASLFSSVLGRPIKHVSLPPEEFVSHMMAAAHLPREYAETMLALDISISEGSQEDEFKSERRVVGKTTFADFIHKHKHVWDQST